MPIYKENMETVFVDTNYFLRFFLNDNTQHHDKAQLLFTQAAQGTIALITSPVVFFEIEWVLSSTYQKNKQDCRVVLERILEMDFIQIPNKELLRTTLSIFSDHSIELVDAHHIAFSHKHGVSQLYTFDKKLQKVFTAVTKN